MNLRRAILMLALFAGGAVWAQAPDVPGAVRFTAFDIFLDSGAQPLAAWQVEFAAAGGSAKIVSIEGGEHPAFKEPPHYDPKAIQHERAILAAFNTAPSGELPTGKTRVATIHVQAGVSSAPEFKLKTQAAATTDGRPLTVQATFKERNAQ